MPNDNRDRETQSVRTGNEGPGPRPDLQPRPAGDVKPPPEAETGRPTTPRPEATANEGVTGSKAQANAGQMQAGVLPPVDRNAQPAIPPDPNDPKVHDEIARREEAKEALEGHKRPGVKPMGPEFDRARGTAGNHPQGRDVSPGGEEIGPTKK